MRLFCKCGNVWLVHSGHAWRYAKARKCPECGNLGKPDEAGRVHLGSRNREIKEAESIRVKGGS